MFVQTKKPDDRNKVLEEAAKRLMEILVAQVDEKYSRNYQDNLKNDKK